MKKTTKRIGLSGWICVAALIIVAVVIVAVVGTGGPAPNSTNPSTNPTTQGTQPSQTNPTTNPTDPHVHEYAEEVVEPTCTENGYSIFTCSCGDAYTGNSVAAKGHTYEEVVTAPTCTEDGYTTFTCSCGDTYTGNPVEATGHSYKETVTAPTCTEAGITTYTCSCGDTYTDAHVAATGHKYTETVVAPTCEKGGYTVHTCTCGETYNSDVVPALGHNWGEWATVLEPTEEAEGKRQRSCPRCSAREDGVIARLPESHKHSYTEVVTKPTCTEVGYTTHTCECGDTFRVNEVPALGHSFTNYVSNNDAECMIDGTMTAACDRGCGEKHTIPDEGSFLGCDFKAVVTAPTCTTGGHTTYTCTRCGYSYESDKTAALGHDFKNYVSNNDATCTKDGTKTGKCTRCDVTDTVTDPGSAKGHSFGDWVTVVEPTEEAEGKQERTCSVCSHKEEKTLPELEHVHQYTTVVTKPTCDDDGYTTYTCRCGDTYTADKTFATGHTFGEYTSNNDATCTKNGTKSRTCTKCSVVDTVEEENTAKGHAYGDWVITNQPTCTEAGEKTKTCSACSDKQTETLDKLGHSFGTYTADGNATCTEDGTKTAKCIRCDATDTVTDTGTAKGHTFGAWVTIVEPTETEKGKAERTCYNCSAKEEDELPVLGHTHTYNVRIISPTCTEQGYTLTTCACGYSKKSDFTNPSGHAYVQTVTDPTCTEGGYTTHKCSVCGHTYKDGEKQALGHDYGNYVSNNDTTCDKDGTLTATCSRCSDTVTVTDKGSSKGHLYGSWKITKDATCTEDGEETRTCLNCPATETKVVVAWGHKYQTTETQPTCTKGGGTIHKCSHCGDVRIENEKPALGHSWTDWETTTNNLCEGSYKKTRTCTTCGEVETEVTHGAHSYTNWTVHSVATCATEGKRTRSCTKCGETITEITPALEHDWHDRGWVVVKQATETEEGEQQRSCTACGHIERRTVPVTTHTHTWSPVETIKPTCTEEGYSTTYCLTCGFGKDDKGRVTAPTGHDWTEWETTKAPAIGVPGYEQRKCKTCGEVEAFAIPPLEEDGEQYESYVDPRVKVENLGIGYAYNYFSRDGGTDVNAVDYRTWGEKPSIWINEDGTMTVVYYNQAGERIEVLVEKPPEGYQRTCIIREDGTYQIALIGGFA